MVIEKKKKKKMIRFLKRNLIVQNNYNIICVCFMNIYKFIDILFLKLKHYYCFIEKENR